VFRLVNRQRDDTTAAPAKPAALGSPLLLILPIALVSGLGTFTAVRSWLPRVHAAPIGSAILTVTSRPAGATVVVDRQPRGSAPLTLAIPSGSHTLSVRVDDVERTLTVMVPASAHVSQDFDLTRTPPKPEGRLSVASDPPGARVDIDGQPHGAAPVLVDGLTPTEHTVRVTSATGSVERAIAVAPGVVTELVVALPRAAASATGWIAVASPFPVDVVENGEVVGTSGAAKIMMAAGRHELVLRNDALGFDSTRAVSVTPGRVAAVDVVAPTARLNVNARPWADVSIDGEPAGQTPMANLELAVGTHEVVFRHPQLGSRTERVVVSARGINRVAVDFNR
jgi:serine/threonine-protein kinase